MFQISKINKLNINLLVYHRKIFEKVSFKIKKIDFLVYNIQ